MLKKIPAVRRLGCLLLMVSSVVASAATYTVSSIAELNSRIASAVAGDVIIVQNGVYTTSASIGVNRVGTAANPILIRAETVGGVEITGSHGFSLNSPAAHVHIQGFKFTHTSGRNSVNNGATFCRFTRNIFECPGDGNYLVISGHDTRVDRNEFRNKSTVGNMIDVRGSGSQIARRVWIHHNYFHDFTNAGENGAETIRFGLSGLSLSTGDGLIEYNLFLRCRGENEMISNKSSGNTYRYNTVLDSPGAEISQRHGNDCLYYGNYMKNTAGIRVYGDRHRIFNNYLEGNTIGVNMGNGDGDVYNGAALTAHDRPDDNIVVFNTFINNNTHYQMGGRTGGLGSSNTVVANNIFQGGGSIASISSSGPYTGTYSNNIRWQTSSTGNMPSSGYMTINPLLAQDANGVYHIQSGSPAINAGVGSHNYYGVFSSYSYVTADMDGQVRDANKDIGADEFSTAPIIARMLTTNDVGPFSIEGGMQFDLAVTPSSRAVLPGGSAPYTATITALNGTTGVVSLSASSLPGGTSAAFAPASVTNSGSSTLTLTASNTAAFGTYTFTVTGLASNATKSVQNSVTIGDFSVSASPASRIIIAGSNTTYTVTLTTNILFNGSVTFGVSGLPAGANANFSPTSLSAAGSVTLTITTTEAVTEGNHPLTITATGGSVGGTAAASVTLSVTGDTAAPGTLIWNGTNNWSTVLNWTNSTAGGFGAPGPFNDVLFTNNAVAGAAGIINNFVDGNYTIASLRFMNSNGFHSSFVASNATLAISNVAAGNALLVTAATNNANQTITATVVGSNGTLEINNPNANVNVRQGGVAGTHRATLDLSSLGTLNANVGRLLIAGDGDSSVGGSRLAGVLYLARTNTIVTSGAAPQINIGDHPSNGRGNPAVTLLPSFLFLGYSNAIFADSITVGRQKAAAVSMLFNPAFAAANPTALFRGTNGLNSRVSLWAVGDNLPLGSSNQATEGTNDFSSGTVDALIDLLRLGASCNGNNVGSGTGMVTFASGVIDVNTIQLGYQTTNSGAFGVGTLNVNGTGELRVNHTLLMARVLGGAGSAFGTLNVNGGRVEATNVVNGGGTATINLNRGTLDLSPEWAAAPGNLTDVSTVKIGAVGISEAALLAGARIVSSPNTIVIAANGVLRGNTIVTSPGLTVGGTVSPGSSIGSLTNNGPATFSAGGGYALEMNDAAGGAGTGWDYLRVTGNLSIAASSGSPFTIRLESLDDDASGEALNFSNDNNYDWEIASAGGGVSGFDAGKFAINTAFFANDLAGGYFFLRQAGNALVLSFTNNHAPTAVPATFYRTGETLVISIAALAANWSDADGDPLVLVELSESSTNGTANVSTDGTNIYYTNVNAVVDAIHYTVGDVRTNAPAIYRGGDTLRTASGVIHIVPQPSFGTIEVSGTGLVLSGAGGVAGETYSILAATNAALPLSNWSVIATGLFNETGAFQFTNTIYENEPQRFYLLQLP